MKKLQGVTVITTVCCVLLTSWFGYRKYWEREAKQCITLQVIICYAKSSNLFFSLLAACCKVRTFELFRVDRRNQTAN